MSVETTVTLASEASATPAYVNVVKSGRYVLAVAGTFGGCTAGIDMLGPDGATAIALKDSSGAIAMTSADAYVLEIGAGSYRLNIAGGSGVSLSATLKKVG